MFRYIFALLLSLVLFISCGIYNLEVSISNPLDGVNIFSGFANKDSAEAGEYQCRIEIDDANWEKAVDLCSKLDMSKAENVALYASALQGKNGADVFILLDAATGGDDEGGILGGFLENLEGTTQTSLDELATSIALLESLPNKDESIYFQIAFAQFTLAASYVAKEAVDNGNTPETAQASDITSMSETELDAVYDNISNCRDNLNNANMSGDVMEKVDEVLDQDLSSWGSMSEAQKETALINLLKLS